MSLPSITVTGVVGRDPELRFTPSGKATASFSVGSNNRRKVNDQWESGPTTWLDVTLWDNAAEAAAEHVKAKDRVTVTGQLQVRDYEGKDGSKRRAVEVVNATVAKLLPTVPKQAAPNAAWDTGGGGNSWAPSTEASPF